MSVAILINRTAPDIFTPKPHHYIAPLAPTRTISMTGSDVDSQDTLHELVNGYPANNNRFWDFLEVFYYKSYR